MHIRVYIMHYAYDTSILQVFNFYTHDNSYDTLKRISISQLCVNNSHNRNYTPVR